MEWVEHLYLVSLQTTRSEYDQPEYVVRRRYNDFIWLRQKLGETNPGHLIPVSRTDTILTRNYQFHHFITFIYWPYIQMSMM